MTTQPKVSFAMRDQLLLLSLSACSVLLTSTSVSAQTVQHIQDSVATISADTGPFAHGPKDYARYTAPDECVAAAQNAIAVYRRSLAVQVAIANIRFDAPDRDTLPHDVAVIASACGAKFTAKGIPDRDLPTLFTLALLESDDSLANAILRHRLTLAATDTEDMETILQDAMSGYLNASPARVSVAEAAAAQIDAIGGVVGIGVRLSAHRMLMDFAESFVDESRIKHEAEQIIALVTSRPKPSQTDAELLASAYSRLMWIAYIDHETDNGDAAGLAIAQQFKQNLEAMKIDVLNLRDKSPKYIRDQLRENLMPNYGGGKYGSPGKLPAVGASYWFPKKPDLWPAEHGQGALIINGGWMLDPCIRDDEFLFGPLRRECTALYTYIGQWANQYEGRLAITLVSMTKGYAVRSLPLPPAAEADSIAWFIRSYLRLPVTVAVVQDSIYQFAAPDSRHFDLDTAFYAHGTWIERGGRGGPTDIEVIYYGPTGKVRYTGQFSPALLRTLLVHDFAAPASVSATSVPKTTPLHKEP